ncbi:MAG: hypothetical protein V3V57_15260 [Spirochaetia bacterium]
MKSVICLILAALIPIGAAVAQTAEGGTTAADFLIFPPATRIDAMGGAVDGLGLDLEGIHFNPALLATVADFRLQLNVNPLPNDISNSQLAAGFPLFGGTFAAAAQMLNTGGFTFVNASGQAEASVAVYDAAAVVGYSRYIWRTISLGLSAKGIYSTLGDYNAFAVAADVGASAWFETPHIGQAPKPPTMKQLEAQHEKEKKEIESEKEKKLKPVTEESAPIRKDIEDLEKQSTDLGEKMAEAEGEKRTELEAKKADVEAQLADLRTQLAAAEVNEKDGVAEIEAWYREEISAANKRLAERLTDLDWVETERRRLFAVIDDPNQELSPETVDSNINESISKTWDFLADRRKTNLSRKETYTERLQTRITEIRQEIADYQEKLEAETGPKATQLNQEIDSLKNQKASLEGSEDPEAKNQIKEIDNQISAKEKELQGLLSDPWLKRLQKRIDEKNEEIEQLQNDIESLASATDTAIEDASAETEKEIKKFEALREELQKELKRAKLKRELDLVDARNEKAIEKAHRNYKAKEKKIYERLLAAMYRNEERIFQARLQSAKEDADSREYDFKTAQNKTRESLEDEFAFQERFLAAKISQLKKESSDSAELASTEEELKAKQEEYKQAVEELDEKAKNFSEAEQSKLDKEVAAITEERRKIRLVFLQTDTPYKNTNVNMVLRNGGTQMTFVSEGYPLPTTFSVAVGYAFVNTVLHNAKLTAQLNVPFYDSISVGIGAEYVFGNLVYVRGGYTFGAVDRSFSTGAGVRLALGFTEVSVDYAFRPLPDYGLLHSIGVALSF